MEVGYLFTPESVMDIQRSIGADIIMAFDECPPGDCDFNYAKTSLALTNRWLDRCIKRFEETSSRYGYTQNLFPIVQGASFKDLRKESCEYIIAKEAAGHAIGGLSVGEPEAVLYDICGWCCEHLPAQKPRYLMGVGTPDDLFDGVMLGIDMFDCVLPTRNARNGSVFVRTSADSSGKIHIKNAAHRSSDVPLDADCAVPDLQEVLPRVPATFVCCPGNSPSIAC